MHKLPPKAPKRSNFLRPVRSIKNNNQIIVNTVFKTPKMPVVRREVFSPVRPRDLKIVGE